MTTWLTISVYFSSSFIRIWTTKHRKYNSIYEYNVILRLFISMHSNEVLVFSHINRILLHWNVSRYIAYPRQVFVCQGTVPGKNLNYIKLRTKFEINIKFLSRNIYLLCFFNIQYFTSDFNKLLFFPFLLDTFLFWNVWRPFNSTINNSMVFVYGSAISIFN